MARQLSRRRPVNPEPVEDDEDEVQEERPARSRRSRRDEDDEDERPARRSKRPASAGKSSARDGWGDGKMKSRDFDKERFVVAEEDKTYLFRFAQEQPIVSYDEHFCMDLPKGMRKSYVCLEDDCPLCMIGDRPGFRRAFNVIVFDKKGNPEVRYWVATPAVISEIEGFAYDEDWVEKHGPLNNPSTYFTVSKSRPKKNAPFKFRLDFIRARDLEDEHNIVPLTADELEELEDDYFTKKDVVREDSVADLEEVAEELG